MTAQHGTGTITFSQMFADTVQAFGLAWAWEYYSRKGMSRAEFRVWAKAYYRAV